MMKCPEDNEEPWTMEPGVAFVMLRKDCVEHNILSGIEWSLRRKKEKVISEMDSGKEIRPNAI